MNRRNAIKNSALAAGGLLLNSNAFANKNKPMMEENELKLKGNFKHSVSHWCYKSVVPDFRELCQEVKAIGMDSIELTGPEEWEIMQEYGLTCAMGWDKYPEGVTLDNFYANPKNHDALEEYFKNLIPKAVKYGIKNLICLSGKRDLRTDYENLINCKNGIQRIIKLAEDNDITISMEYLNSKVNHPDHQFDNMEWGVALCEMVDSPNFKILYDIYHAQIMEGDVVATIRKYADYISHYHTAGVPGRNEINETQELNYRFIMQEIAKTGYKGFIGQEFIPTGETKKDKLMALKESVRICDA
jgi:hydroxypyruvate isomerase